MSRADKIQLLEQLNGVENPEEFLPSGKFNTPNVGGLRKSAVSNRSNVSKKSSARSTASKKSNKAKKPSKITCLQDMVKKKDRLTHELLIEYLNNLLEC